MDTPILRQDFYVYLHRRKTDGKVFYVGKGKEKRAWDLSGRNRYWKVEVSNHGFYVDFFANGLTEIDANATEIRVISEYGKNNLTNLTNGGQGVSGHTPSAESNRKRSESLIALLKDPEMRKKYGDASRKSHAQPERKKNDREAQIRAWQDSSIRSRRSEGIKKSWARPGARKMRIDALKASLSRPEKRAIKSAAMIKRMRETGSKKIVCVELGICFFSITGAREYLRANGWPKALSGNICWCCKGMIEKAYELTWAYIPRDNPETPKTPLVQSVMPLRGDLQEAKP